MVSRGCSVCGGGGDTCNCLVVAGDNIDVAGVGSTEFPYVISAPDVPKAQKVWCGADGIPIGYSLVDKEGVQEFFLSNGSFAGLILPDGWEECKCVCQSGTGGTLYPDWQTLVINGLGELALAYDGVETVYIKNANVTAEKVDLSVADQTARDAIASPWEGLLVYREDLDKQQIYDGAAWRTLLDWDILANVTASGSSTTLSTGTFASRDVLQVFMQIDVGAGGSDAIDGILRVNNDSGANYARRHTLNGAAEVGATSQTSALATLGMASGWSCMGVGTIFNPTTRRKRGMFNYFDTGVAASTAPNHLDHWFGWVNLVNKITRIDVLNTGAFAVGNIGSTSKILVLGANY